MRETILNGDIEFSGVAKVKNNIIIKEIEYTRLQDIVAPDNNEIFAVVGPKYNSWKNDTHLGKVPEWLILTDSDKFMVFKTHVKWVSPSLSKGKLEVVSGRPSSSINFTYERDFYYAENMLKPLILKTLNDL